MLRLSDSNFVNSIPIVGGFLLFYKDAYEGIFNDMDSVYSICNSADAKGRLIYINTAVASFNRYHLVEVK